MIWAQDNAACRHRFVVEWLRSIPSGKTILDAGAGIQRYKQYAAHLNYTSQDFGSYEGGEDFGEQIADEWDSSGCDLICDIINIPVQDGSYDYILCTEVFEHLPSPEKALKEFARILKPKGKLLLTAPFRCLYHQEPYFFYSGFSVYWYKHFCDENRLKIDSIAPNGSYVKDIAQDMITITCLGSPLRRKFAKLLALPFYIYLYILDKSKTKMPTSCAGYHLIISKIEDTKPTQLNKLVSPNSQ